MERLTSEELEQALRLLTGWKREEEKWIVKTYLFERFPQTMAFIQQVGLIAEEMNHHPFIYNEYRKVRIKLTSWNAGGITALDLDAVQRYDEAFEGIRVDQS